MAFTEGVLEIHGNWRFMRCLDEQNCVSRNNFYKTPVPLPPLKDVEDGNFEMPKCKFCGSVMKPHTMLFDERYSEKYYRVDSVNQALSQSNYDTLVIVGT